MPDSPAPQSAPSRGSGNVGRNARSSTDNTVGITMMQQCLVGSTTSTASTACTAAGVGLPSPSSSSFASTTCGHVTLLRNGKRMRSSTNSSQDEGSSSVARPAIMKRLERPAAAPTSMSPAPTQASYRTFCQPLRGRKPNGSPRVNCTDAHADDDLLYVMMSPGKPEVNTQRANGLHKETQVSPSLHVPSLGKGGRETCVSTSSATNTNCREVRSAWTQTRSLMFSSSTSFLQEATAPALPQSMNEASHSLPRSPPSVSSASILFDHRLRSDASSQTSTPIISFAAVRSDLSELIITLQAFLSVS